MKLQQLKKQVQNQENKINIQEKKIQNQEKKIQNQQKKTQDQEKKIQNQDHKASIQENKIENQQKKIQDQENKIKDIVSRTERLHPSETSCSALLKRRPSTPSGMYYINPQGLRSSPLVQVFCDMTSQNGGGVTAIGHDSESRTLVKGYDPEGSYKRKIKYDISMEQILTIMKQSKNCEQLTKYECYGSVLLRDSHGWWVSRQGWKMNYWGGAAVNSGKCACGMTNSCPGGWKCNCDQNDQTWREDSGYLTDKNTLPVSEMRFGDAGDPSYESGFHTLGRLRCWG